MLIAPVDAADKVSCRPDFAIAIYPGHMLENTTKEFELNPEIPRITSNTPPTFLLQNEDDHVDGVKQSLIYYIALEERRGSRGDALVCAGRTCVRAAAHEASDPGWPELVEKWLGTIGMISKQTLP